MEEAGGRECEKSGMKIEESAGRTRWREGKRAIAEEMRCIRLLLATRKKMIETG